MASSCTLLLFIAAPCAALRLPPALLDISRQHASAFACVAVLATSQPMLPAFAASCQLDCFKECNKVAPGSGAYCTSQCDSYCEELGGDYQGDVVRGEATPAAGAALSVASGNCDAYKTEAAKKYCSQQAAAAVKAAKATDDASPLAMNNGIFGDSGVTYSKDLENLFATAFGATRQSRDVSKANVNEFGSDIADAAKKAFIGQPSESAASPSSSSGGFPSLPKLPF